jgi:site-specific DNA-methyltransferase (adenine-specific)
VSTFTHAPGTVRDPIISFLETSETDASLREIFAAVRSTVGEVSESSVRSYLNLNTPRVFTRTTRGRYKLVQNLTVKPHKPLESPSFRVGNATLVNADCMGWLTSRESSSIHAVITDPPYGLKEYSANEQGKLRSGKGGVWRIPPAFDGSQRSPLPRFTVLDDTEKKQIEVFFKAFGMILRRVLVPGANVAIASNPLLAHLVSSAMTSAGFEIRGSVIRLTMTMRGGDRPKNAHTEFTDVSVMPRSMWEPWVIVRKPLEGRVQDNLRKWKTGGWRRPSANQPFGDVLKSSPTSAREKAIAPHPSLKPQSFLRRLVYASLPLGEGIVLDPFAGSGSTLAAANAVGYQSIGVERDEIYARLARKSIKPLSDLKLIDPIIPELLNSFSV